MAWYQPDSFHITVGSVVSGVITDTYTDNGVRHRLAEASGSPGMDYEYWYASVPAYAWIRLHVNGYYEGNPAHDVEVYIWNFTTSAWHLATIMYDDVADANYNSIDLPGANYISGGQVKVRFLHPDSGVTTHYLYLDEVILEDRSSFHSTAAPTTAAPTTVAPSTLAPTTTLTTAVPPTTSAPTTTLTTAAPTTTLTTLAPTTAWGEDINLDPLEITLSQYYVLHYNPPAQVNPGLNTEYDFSGSALEIELSLEGTNQYVGILLSSLDIVMSLVTSSPSIGQVITITPLNITIIPVFDFVGLDLEECNWVWWSKIGALDFTIDESNIAGKRPMNWKGCIYHARKLGSSVVVYGANGVSMMKPSGVHFGMDTIYRIGLKNKGAFAGNDKYHFFVDLTGQLFQLDSKLNNLNYAEFLNPMGTIILSLDEEKELLYITDGTTGYVYSIRDKSLGRAIGNLTGFGVQSNTLFVVSDEAIVTPKFEITTDIYDLGTRKPKTVQWIELGTDLSEFLFVSVDYRKSYRDDFRQIGWFVVNHDGRAYPKCYGVEFRFRVKSTIYEYFELDYIKVRGHINGYSYLDTAR